MGSLSSACDTMRLSSLPSRLSRRRPPENVPTSPPEEKREPTTMSRSRSRSVSSMRGRMVSSCCRSASMTATNGASVASMPSMQADERPRRPIRRITRTRGMVLCRPSRSSAVPSCESSSTNTTSQAIPASASPSPASSGAMLSLSFRVGTITASCGGASAALRAGACAVSCEVSACGVTWLCNLSAGSLLIPKKSRLPAIRPAGSEGTWRDRASAAPSFDQGPNRRTHTSPVARCQWFVGGRRRRCNHRGRKQRFPPWATVCIKPPSP